MTKLWVGIMFAALVVGTVLVFRELDTSSHSASDTLRPFLITVGPLWVAAVIAARIVRRGSRT